MRCDVLILGAGWSGLSIAKGLRDRGVNVRVVDPRGLLGGASGRALGIALPCPPEHPHRLESALGTARAAELVEFAREGLATLPGFARTGVRWRVMGQEVHETEDSVAAAGRIGLDVERTHDGFHLQDGGQVDLAAFHAALATEVLTEPIPAEITVHATGWAPSLGFLDDKVMPVRWQGARFEGPILPFPVISQHATLAWVGGFEALGARWATPHMEVGETEEAPSAVVERALEHVTRVAFPEVRTQLSTWAGIVAESCDGLPFMGPIPGRPRDVVCGGFGFHGLPMIWRSAQAIVEGLLGGRASEVPSSLRVSRFL